MNQSLQKSQRNYFRREQENKALVNSMRKKRGLVGAAAMTESNQSMSSAAALRSDQPAEERAKD